MARAFGKGNITPSGYIRLKIKGQLIFEHRYIWEKFNGKIPDGFEIHHKNGNKQDNRLSNLELITRLEHRRLHEGWKLENNLWLKKCPDCNWWLEVNNLNWYFTTEKNRNKKPGAILFGRCRKCHIRKVNNARKAKKIANRSFTYSA
jgi:hypothetical protein